MAFMGLILYLVFNMKTGLQPVLETTGFMQGTEQNPAIKVVQ
jgi:hypothetical protein